MPARRDDARIDPEQLGPNPARAHAEVELGAGQSESSSLFLSAGPLLCAALLCPLMNTVWPSTVGVVSQCPSDVLLYEMPVYAAPHPFVCLNTIVGCLRRGQLMCGISSTAAL